MNQAELFSRLEAQVRDRQLRHLSLALARFLAELGVDDVCVLLAAVMLSEAEAQGHSCISLATLAQGNPVLVGQTADEEAEDISWPDTQPAWQSRLVACPQVDAGEDKPAALLVLRHQRLYLRRYWQYESGIAAALLRRVATKQDVKLDIKQPVEQAGNQVVNEEAIRALLPVLFGNAQQNPDWQRIACAIAMRGRLTVITGGPGTGKTHTAARLLALYFASSGRSGQLRVGLAAPTGKAAARLKQSIDQALQSLVSAPGVPADLRTLIERTGAARTLHSLLGARPDTRRFLHHAGNPLDLDLLIVDEASMIHLEMMHALLDALLPTTTLILLGDKDQLASVEAGAVLGDLCSGAEAGNYSGATLEFIARTTGQTPGDEFTGPGSAVAQQTVMLRHSHRFGGEIGQLALAVNRGETQAAVAILTAGTKANGTVHWLKKARLHDVLELSLPSASLALSGYAPYLDLLKALPQQKADFDIWAKQLIRAFEQFRLLCAVREGEWGVSGLNQALEQHFRRCGAIGAQAEWYAGRPVMVTRNDYASGVFNGDIGMTLPDPERAGVMRVYFLEGDTLRSILATRLRYVETAYAMTIHKSQGSEFAHTVMVLPPDHNPVLTRELLYTGITRARDAFTLVTPADGVLAPAVAQRTRRTSGLAQLLAMPAD